MCRRGFGVMFFLLRMAFWLGLVLILLPSGSSRQPQGNQVAPSEAISAASATVGDLRQFCARQPDACTVGSHVASQLGSRAQAGARMLYEFVTDNLKRKDGDNAGRDGKPAADRAVADKDSQNTLTPADLATPWRGPALRKDARHAV
jgi:Family of unknown function (DUF5330)